MTVSTEVDHNEYTGNGVTTSFPYTFRVFNKSDLVVQVIDLDENITVLALDTDYTVTGAGGYNGGNVILSKALANGYQISISRELPVTQETDLRNQGKFFAEVHEDAFDKLTMLIQQVGGMFRLALRKPSSIANWYDALGNYIRNVRDPRDDQDAATKNYVDTLASSNLSRTMRVPEPINQLPNAAARANKMPVFDSTGQPIVVTPPSGSATDVLLQLASYNPPGTDLIGTEANMNLTDYLNRTLVYLDDILPASDGSVDCAPALNSFISNINGSSVVRLAGTKGKIYRFDDTINLNGVVGLEIDFNWATINDNVQGSIPVSANRSKHLFSLYQAKNVKVHRAYINEMSTRTNLGNPDIPTCLFWVGGQYQGSELTDGVDICDIKCFNGKLGMLLVSVVGETRNGTIRNIHIEGNFSYGVNFEYGLQPEDPAVNPTWTNGKHPYNWKVENFNGFNLLNCAGFLRVASCFNIKFKNCVGYNVKAFIYCYCGDRNISRVSQSVRFVNCKSKIDESVLYSVNYAITIIVPNKDGSTGVDLPSWTNYTHQFSFENCEIWNNTASGSACVRFYGNKGKTLFKNCIFKKSFRGVHGAPGPVNATYVTDNGLELKGCVFESNYQDVYLANIIGTVIDFCSFRSQQLTSTLSQVEIDGGALKTKIQNCDFKGQSVNRPYITTSTASPGTYISNCDFSLASVGYVAMFLGSPANGYDNTTNGSLINRSNLAGCKLSGQPETEIRAITTGGVLDYNIVSNATISTVISSQVTSLVNGILGKRFTITVSTSSGSVTIVNAASGVATGDRFVTLSGSNKTLTGRSSASFIKLDSGWYEI